MKDSTTVCVRSVEPAWFLLILWATPALLILMGAWQGAIQLDGASVTFLLFVLFAIGGIIGWRIAAAQKLLAEIEVILRRSQ